MNDETVNCYNCKTPLKGGTDTFGSIHKPLCLSCWWMLVECTPKFVTEVITSLDSSGNIIEYTIRRVLVSEENEAEYERFN